MQKLLKKVEASWKAVAATFTTALITFLQSTGDGLTVLESARSALLGLLSGFVVWLTRNKDEPVYQNAPSNRRPLAG